MRVLICRSERENLDLQNKLKSMGFEVVLINLFKFIDLNVDFKIYEHFKKVIITSKFAANIVSERQDYNIDCFVVGKESALILSKNKYINVVSSYNDVNSLIKDLKLKDMKDGVIYYSGNFISQEIPFANRVIIYNTEYLRQLDRNVVDHVRKGEIDFILLYSKKAAETLFLLLKSYKLLSLIKNSVVIGISEHVIEPFRPISKDFLYSKSYTQEEMLVLLRSHYL